MSTGRHRRDVLLDSGAISSFASDLRRLRNYALLAFGRTSGGFLIPVPVLTEVYSGQRATDVLVDRLCNQIAVPGRRFAALSSDTATRAGVLRGLTIRNTDLDISAIDAQLVAIAEERSLRNAITIVTSDLADIAALVETTGRSNIAVDPV